MNTTAQFLRAISPEAKDQILNDIANDYGISVQEALNEVTDPESEHLLDYMTGCARRATSVLMQKHGFR